MGNGTPMTRAEWDELAARLRAPFNPAEVDFRVQGRASETTGKAQVVAYVDARCVQDRLDSVVGAGDWSFDWTPLVVDNGEVQVAKGTLTICGVSKADAGSASNFEQSLGAVSHCFKRAAVHWGIGRYLYSIGAFWVAVEKGGRLSRATLNELRAKLPRPTGMRAPVSQAATTQAAAPADARDAASVAVVREPQAAQSPRRPDAPPAARPSQASAAPSAPPMTDSQRDAIGKLSAALDRVVPPLDGVTAAEASLIIKSLSAEWQQQRQAALRQPHRSTTQIAPAT